MEQTCLFCKMLICTSGYKNELQFLISVYHSICMTLTLYLYLPMYQITYNIYWHLMAVKQSGYYIQASASLQVPCGTVKQKTNLLNHEKSLMFKYGRTHKKISSWLVCGSHGTCLDCMLLRVQVTAGLGFFTVFRSFSL